MPSLHDEEELQAVIDNLSSRFGSPRFRPHLTLFEEVRYSAQDLASIVLDASEGIRRFDAAIGAIETSALYFRSFYARFSACAPLHRLHEAVASRLGAAKRGDFVPHISLLYGADDTAAKRQAQLELTARLIHRPVRFDRVCVVASAKDIPIADWAVRATMPLAP